MPPIHFVFQSDPLWTRAFWEHGCTEEIGQETGE